MTRPRTSEPVNRDKIALSGKNQCRLLTGAESSIATPKPFLKHRCACIACADRIRAAEQTIAFIADLEAHHEPPHAIAENFAARLAVSRHAQKRLSLKVITTVFVGGMIVIGLVH
jgi:hypothetical protein